MLGCFAVLLGIFDRCVIMHMRAVGVRSPLLDFKNCSLDSARRDLFRIRFEGDITLPSHLLDARNRNISVLGFGLGSLGRFARFSA